MTMRMPTLLRPTKWLCSRIYQLGLWSFLRFCRTFHQFRSPHTPKRRQQPAGEGQTRAWRRLSQPMKGRRSSPGQSVLHLASLEAPTTQPRCCERCARPQRTCTQEEGSQRSSNRLDPAIAAAAAMKIAKRFASYAHEREDCAGNSRNQRECDLAFMPHEGIPRDRCGAVQRYLHKAVGDQLHDCRASQTGRQGLLEQGSNRQRDCDIQGHLHE